MDQNTKILEALKMQPLSEEEKTARHILGRLYGPIATCKESTRNGRLYNKPLWEKALVDEIFLEKVATKALFLELGHPADREETDIKQACACIPEVPRIVDNDLYAYVDILDTPNGRLLKTLVDYGFVPGISSRGSGDLMEDDVVDPETFFLETWDIVQLPAVKKARLTVCESLNTNNLKLRKALTESISSADEKDQETMKKALENLEIEYAEPVVDPGVYPDPEENTLTEDSEEEVIALREPEEISTDVIQEESVEEVLTEESAEDPEIEEEEVPAEEEVEASADTEEENSEESEDKDAITVGDLVDAISDIEPDAEVVLEPVEIEGVEHEINLEIEADTDTNTVTMSVEVAEPVEESEEELDDNAELELPEEDTEESEEQPEDEETDPEAEDDADEADDDGTDEVIESLKEMIRSKDALEKEVKLLRSEKTVGDAKVKELQEELAKYKEGFVRVSALAAKNAAFEKEVTKLSEQLVERDTTIEALTAQAEQSKTLKESMDTNAKRVQTLTESLKAAESKEHELTEKLATYAQKFSERTEIAKKYKSKFLETLNHYVKAKASMLGVSPSEITSRLSESYTVADIDAVCDQMLDSTINFSRLPFSGRNKASARITESVNKPVVKTTNPEFGYEIDDDLLELAGLK